MRLALLPEGAFEMGSSVHEEGHTRGESPHIVRITRPFYMSIHEVTQIEYESVMDTNPSAFSRTGAHSAKVQRQDCGQFPVESVSWYDAIEFCNELSTKDGLKKYYSLGGVEREEGSIKSASVTVIGGEGYRLPTESEWEYACRSGRATTYCTGNAVAALAEAGWYGGQTSPAGNSEGRPHRVGQKPRNGFGLSDLHGNVAEWCQDWYDFNYYEHSPRNDPAGPSGSTSRVLRGGGWNDAAVNCRSASRSSGHPSKRSDDLGFRVVRQVAQQTQRQKASVPPYRIVIDVRDGRTIDLYINEIYDSAESAKRRLAESKLYGRTGNIRILDGNGNPAE